MIQKFRYSPAARFVCTSVLLLAALIDLTLSKVDAWQPAEGVAELVLSKDFQTSESRSMPSAAVPPGLNFEVRNYAEHRAVEWQVQLQRPLEGVPPLYEDLKSADFIATFPTDRPIALHWSNGSHADISDFQPHVQALTPGEREELESFGGRSSDGVMPYFHLASEGGGLIVALGWPGDWKASFELLAPGKVRVKAGLKRSRFRLDAGEKVRLPSLLLMSYRGDWIDGQNQFRRLMLSHFTPTTHPPMELMPVAASVHGMLGFNVTTEENLNSLAKDIRLDTDR